MALAVVTLGLSSCHSSQYYYYKFPEYNFAGRPIPPSKLAQRVMIGVTANGSSGSFELPFVVQGPWDDPIMLPDPQILIRRSPAAAPLFNSVRDQKTQEKVRSAIERLTGARTAPSASAAPPEPAPETAAPADPQKSN